MSNKITCNNYIYQDSDINAGNCTLGNSLANEELSIDTLDVDVKMGDTVFMPSDAESFESSDGEELTCANPISGYAYGDAVRYEHDDTLIGKFYFEGIKRESTSLYAFSAISAVGILDNRTHYGGIYTEVPAGTIIADIMGEIPYAISDDVASVSMNGYLPIDTRRNNLQQVLFAIGAGVFKDSGGDIAIRFISETAPSEIPDSRIYADGAVDYQTPCTEVDVSEHNYHAYDSDKTVTLLDTSETLVSQLIMFDNPCHDLVASGLTIEESGVNYAIVSGTGTLTGQEYTHTSRVVAYSTGVSGAANVVSVTDATLVSAFNSYNVAQRVAQYYSAVSVVSVGIVMGDERPTDKVTLSNPFGEKVTGYIRSMDVTISGSLKADSEIAVGFVPTGQGNNFNNYVLLTGSGLWTVPDGVNRAMVILVAGGNGGKGGNGGNGGGYVNIPGSGGSGNAGGAAPKIYIINMDVVPGEEYAYSCGAGGSGGAGGAGGIGLKSTEQTGGAGSDGAAGGDTTFGELTSASGTEHDAGYPETKTGLTLGAPGDSGISGAIGGASTNSPGNITYEGVTYVGGATGTKLYNKEVYGGFGGGAAAGSNGGDGADAYDNGVLHNGIGGTGGAAVSVSDAAVYGCSGPGGNGGGGGGASGYLDPSLFPSYSLYTSGGGPGGAGSAGGDGAPGCVIIYY